MGNNDLYVPYSDFYRNIVMTNREKRSQLISSKIDTVVNDVLNKIASLEPPGNFYMKDHKEDSEWELMPEISCRKITNHFLSNGFKSDADSMLSFDSDDQSSNKGDIKLMDNDVISHRYKPGHPGTAHYYELLDLYIEETATSTYAAVAETIFHEVKALDPPGRFLKKVGKDEWEEQSPSGALKKIQNELSMKFKKLYRRKG